VAPFFQDETRQRHRVAYGRDAGDGAVREPVALHDGGVHLNRAIGGEGGAAPGVESRVVLERAHGGLDRRHRSASPVENGPARREGVAYTRAQLLVAELGIRAGAAVNQQSGDAACHGLLRTARIIG
jgi:hypothetical protein